MAKEKDCKLKISLSDEFIKDKKINDLLYCWLQVNSYYDAKSQTRRINKDNINLSSLQVELEITRKTLRNDLNYLIENKYIELDAEYYILNETDGRFVMIGQGLLTHMVLSNYRNIVKVYCILKSYYDMNKENSFFTKTMLLDKIGYNKTTTSNYKKMDDILSWFVKNRYLIYSIDGNNKQIKHKIEKVS